MDEQVGVVLMSLDMVALSLALRSVKVTGGSWPRESFRRRLISLTIASSSAMASSGETMAVRFPRFLTSWFKMVT